MNQPTREELAEACMRLLRIAWEQEEKARRFHTAFDYSTVDFAESLMKRESPAFMHEVVTHEDIPS